MAISINIALWIALLCIGRLFVPSYSKLYKLLFSNNSMVVVKPYYRFGLHFFIIQYYINREYNEAVLELSTLLVICFLPWAIFSQQAYQLITPFCRLSTYDWLHFSLPDKLTDPACDSEFRIVFNSFLRQPCLSFVISTFEVSFNEISHIIRSLFTYYLEY